MAVELLDLAVAYVPEVGGGDVELGPRRLDHAGGRLERPEEGALDRQFDRDDIPEHIDPAQFPVHVGKQFAHPDNHIAQMLTAVALPRSHTADAVEHTVLSEQIDEPLRSE